MIDVDSISERLGLSVSLAIRRLDEGKADILETVQSTVSRDVQARKVGESRVVVAKNRCFDS